MSNVKRKFDANFDPYKVLGIQPSSSDKEIDKAFKKQALKWHPDKNPDNLDEAQKRFVEIYRAYEFLKDTCKKTEYDEQAAAKKKRADYDHQRKATSSAKRQYFMDKLNEKEKAFETRKPASTAKPSASRISDEDPFIRKLRREGVELLTKMAEESAAAERLAKQQEMIRRQREQTEASKPSTCFNAHPYNMSFDELSAFEDEVLGS